MKVLSVNIGKKEKIPWRGKMVETGIYKKPVDTSIFLGSDDVVDDDVVDRKHHGGKDMAVYAYSKKNYNFFQNLYPEVEFVNGIFGENLTFSDLDETVLQIGDSFQIGEAIIQVSQPRKPCFKLGVRFGSQKVVKQFLDSTYCGVYFRVLQEGVVSKGDKLVLINKAENSLTVAEVYSVFSSNKENEELRQRIIELEFVAEKLVVKLQKLSK